MTAHELAMKLLEGPDYPVIVNGFHHLAELHVASEAVSFNAQYDIMKDCMLKASATPITEGTPIVMIR